MRIFARVLNVGLKACTHVRIAKRTCTQRYALTQHTRARTYTRTHTCKHTHTHIQTHTQANTRACTHVCTHAHACTLSHVSTTQNYVIQQGKAWKTSVNEQRYAKRIRLTAAVVEGFATPAALSSGASSSAPPTPRIPASLLTRELCLSRIIRRERFSEDLTAT